MFIKLGIIIGIVILGGMIFSNEIYDLFPTTSATVVDSLQDDVDNLHTKALDSAEQRIDKSIDKTVDKTSNTITNEINKAGNKISSEISEVKESSQKIIGEEISNFNPIESIQNIFTGDSNSQNSDSFTSTTISDSSTTPIIYETLSLSTKQQSDDNILLQYFDSSGKTISVNVVI
jgi:gas vesicle protein